MGSARVEFKDTLHEWPLCRVHRLGSVGRSFSVTSPGLAMLQYALLGYIVYECYRMAQMPNFGDAQMSDIQGAPHSHTTAAKKST
ncbi:hypothetical protein QR680_015179 [Steinernema hermaphroditum]|uniref:Uncharacterized protein n=1 Tax=Steinernema hermaphroditum TaxID=289476 RepID=A0AA39IBG1_9BILA|nr:hypothetical protein QR680_015179 [Steinernema hermaphroditum]